MKLWQKPKVKQPKCFFSNVTKNLEIPLFNMNDSISENIADPQIKAVVTYRNHTLNEIRLTTWKTLNWDFPLFQISGKY